MSILFSSCVGDEGVSAGGTSSTVSPSATSAAQVGADPMDLKDEPETDDIADGPRPEVPQTSELIEATRELLARLGIDPSEGLVDCVAATEGTTADVAGNVFSDPGRRWLLGLIECDVGALADALVRNRTILGRPADVARCVVVERLSELKEMTTTEALDVIESGGALNLDVSAELIAQIAVTCDVDTTDVIAIVLEAGN